MVTLKFRTLFNPLFHNKKVFLRSVSIFLCEGKLTWKICLKFELLKFTKNYCVKFNKFSIDHI